MKENSEYAHVLTPVIGVSMSRLIILHVMIISLLRDKHVIINTAQVMHACWQVMYSCALCITIDRVYPICSKEYGLFQILCVCIDFIGFQGLSISRHIYLTCIW